MKATLLPKFFPSLHMELTARWLFEAIAAGIGAGLLGALGATAYALRVDPVEVLTYE
jgi:ABC-type antimicrobial peptide transport system permease subunit